MNFRSFSRYFGGIYMKYWYAAFAVVMLWFLLNLFNNGAVSSYKLTAYSTDGSVIGSKIVRADSMTAPERLPVSKSYEPIKPVKFLK